MVNEKLKIKAHIEGMAYERAAKIMDRVIPC